MPTSFSCLDFSETVRLMEEIDDVIQRHGGRPRAFQADVDEEKLVRKVTQNQRSPYGRGQRK
jgi:hypothetical protein